MSRMIGIDLGTTNSLAACVDAGIPLVLADAEGQRLTPSVVYLPGEGRDPVVGAPASRQRILEPRRTIYSIKRFMGRRGADISREEMVVTYPVVGQSAGPVSVPVGGRSWLPEEISAEILKKLKRDAEQSLSEPVTRAVITVPAYFNDAQRSATKKAGELAGLTVERILNEPTAAALAYGLDRLPKQTKVAVYDLGGGTFDLSILELNEGVFQVLSTHGNTRLGGEDIDRKLVDHLSDQIRKGGGPDPTGDAVLMSRLQEAAEQAKIRLSTETETEVTLPFLSSGYHFQQVLTRDTLEELAGEVVRRTRAHCLRSLEDAGLKASELDQVILVGGQTRMPMVRRFVAELFGCAEFEEERGGLRLGAEHHRAEGPRLNTSQNPDEAVALGAAIQAEILSGGFRNMLLLDVTPLSLGIETFGGLMNVILPRNSTIPVKAGEMFTTAMDFQKDMMIHVLQGERERAKDNWSLGRFTLDFEPAPRGAARVGVQFEIDANGILHVLARDTRTGREKVMEMKSAVDVDDADVQRMVEESVEHAFDDLAARQWIEAKLRAEETLKATERGMRELGEALDSKVSQAIREAREKVEEVLRGEDPASGSGNVRWLKETLGQLDAATQPLADLMMDRAMEAVLRKRGMIS